MLNHNRWSVSRSLLVIAIITVMAPLFIGTTVQAQDFGQLLEAVDKLEANLKSLVAQERTAREQAIAELRDGAGQSLPGLDPAWQKKISGELASLRTQIKGLTGDQPNQELAAMANDIEFLKAENLYLRSTLNKNAQQYVSVDGEYAAPNDETIEQLTRTVLLLNERIEDIAGHSQPAGVSHAKNESHDASAISIHGKLYSHGMADFSDGDDSHSEFALSRAYITMRTSLADFASLRVTTDFKTFDGKYNIIIKYAYLDMKPGFTQGIAKLRLGMQPTQYIDHMNKLWGRRYVSKTVGDEHHILTSSDLGISTIVGFGQKSEYGFASLALLNGTSYSDVGENNDRKDFNFVTVVTPLKHVKPFSKSTLMFQFYSGTQNELLNDLESVDTSASPWDTTVTTVSASDWKRQIVSVGGLLAWNSTLDFGFDLNYATVGDGPGHEAIKTRALSFFTSFRLKKLAGHSAFAKTLNFFGRMDLYDHNTHHDDDGETATWFGVECSPVHGFYASLNYQMVGFEDDALDSENMLYLNTQFKF